MFDDEDIYGQSSAREVTPLPGETILVYGARGTQFNLVISNTVEKNCVRDARMLATALSVSLDQETLAHLTELLLAEYMVAPMVAQQQRMAKQAPTTEGKRNPRRRPKLEEDQFGDSD